VKRFRLFGTLELIVGDDAEQCVVPLQPKRAAVLAYLAAARPGPLHRRDTLLSLFWPESTDEHARNALSKTLHYLRERIGAEALVSHGDEIGLSPDAMWCDVTAFEDAADRGDLEEALSLYSGHFMDGFHVDADPDFEHWLDARRKPLRLRACELAWGMSEATETSGDRSAAERWGRTAVGWAPEDEAGLRRLLILLQTHGNRASAIQAHDDFAARLLADYGVEPSDPTRELIAAIREGSIESAPLEVADQPHRSSDALEPESGDRRDDPTIERSARKTTRRRALAGTAALAVAWTAYVALVGLGTETAPAEADVSSIAVLPFENLSEGTAPPYFADGLADRVSAHLQGIESLRVMDRTEATQLADPGSTLQAMVEASNVETMLEGSISQVGAQLRVSARLREVGTQDILWSAEFLGADAGRLLRKAALAIAAALEPIFAPDESRLALRAAAFEHYQKATLVVRGRNADADRMAIVHLREAIAVDSTFADAFGGIGWIYGDLSGRTGEPQWADSAEAFARRSIALDGASSQGHMALARSFDARGRLAEARLAFLAGMEATETLGGFALDLSALSVRMGRLDEGLYWAERVLVASRGGGSANVRYHVGLPLLALGDDERTQEYFEESLEILDDLREDPFVARLHGLYAQLDLSRGRFEEAMRRFRDRADAYPAHEGILGDLAWAAYITGSDDARDLMESTYFGAQLEDNPAYGFLLVEAGDRERGRRVLDQAWRSWSEAYADGAEDPEIAQTLAAISAARGESDEAFLWAERAYEAGLRDPLTLRLDPMFGSIRGDERFQQLIARIEVDREEMRRRAFSREGSMFRDSVGAR
jgi:DNA-binding SARP family transcriptional activator/TolB-like protein